MAERAILWGVGKAPGEGRRGKGESGSRQERICYIIKKARSFTWTSYVTQEAGSRRSPVPCRRTFICVRNNELPGHRW